MLLKITSDIMAVVRLDDKLYEEILEWLKENGNKYKIPSITAFVNNAVYEKMKSLGVKNEQ